MVAYWERYVFKKKTVRQWFYLSQPGKEFEIQKRLDKLREINSNEFNNNNNNNNNNNPDRGGVNLNLRNYGLDEPPPSLQTIEDFIENGIPPPPTLPPGGGENISFNIPRPPTISKNNFNFSSSRPFVLPNIDNNRKIGNDLLGSIGAMAGPQAAPPEKARQEIDDFLYELLDTGMPTLEIGDKLLDTLGTEAEDLFNNVPTKKEEEYEVLQKIIDEYDIPGMKDTMDETSKFPENIYFFYGGDSQQFVDALEFLGLTPINREFDAFLLSDLGRKTMTQNKLSIHVESGDIFLNKTMKLLMFLKKFHTIILLRNISLVFCRISLSMTKKNLTFLRLKIQNIFSINLMTLLKCTVTLDINYLIPEKCLILLFLKN